MPSTVNVANIQATTLTVDSIEIDPTGASVNQVLKFDGTKFTPSLEGNITGTIHTDTIGDGTNSSYTITHGLGTRNVVVVIRNAASPYEVIQARWEATTTSTITVDFSSPVTSDSIVVSVYATVAGSPILSYKETIGNSTDSTYVITHALNTRDIVISIRNADSPYESINARWEATTVNTVTFDFSAPLANNSVRVGIVSI